mmetsp:Transcript_56097/g.181992  ORF Transcript_56097/g.181992 Transcript_56097/m.181992 type:complete len:269 (-) Transcript_56097:7080-7886(-)
MPRAGHPAATKSSLRHLRRCGSTACRRRGRRSPPNPQAKAPRPAVPPPRAAALHPGRPRRHRRGRLFCPCQRVLPSAATPTRHLHGSDSTSGRSRGRTSPPLGPRAVRSRPPGPPSPSSRGSRRRAPPSWALLRSWGRSRSASRRRGRTQSPAALVPTQATGTFCRSAPCQAGSAAAGAAGAGPALAAATPSPAPAPPPPRACARRAAAAAGAPRKAEAGPLRPSRPRLARSRPKATGRTAPIRGAGAPLAPLPVSSLPPRPHASPTS